MVIIGMNSQIPYWNIRNLHPKDLYINFIAIPFKINPLIRYICLGKNELIYAQSCY
jgi:hypothetical protein